MCSTKNFFCLLGIFGLREKLRKLRDDVNLVLDDVNTGTDLEEGLFVCTFVQYFVSCFLVIKFLHGGKFVCLKNSF